MKKSDRTRQRILDAAAIEFRDKGFESTRLADIAARAELQTPSLYYHFESKEEIIEVVLSLSVEQTFNHVKERVAAIPEDQPLDRLRAAIAAHVEMSQQHGDYSAATLRLYGQMPKDMQKRLRKTQREVGAFWNGLLVAAQDAGKIRADVDLSVARMLLLGALNWAVEWYKPSRRLTVADLAQQASDMVVDGLRSQ
ncbi:MAG: hypothetical protein QOF76_2884 [Solirubrobacteraceae bacterium]|nr:hypothetical protein [Solirubrobacteraceae bacterium]